MIISIHFRITKKMQRRRLGVNITQNITNDFFAVKPSINQHSIPKHHVGSSQLLSRSNSNGSTPRLPNEDVQYFEQQLKLSSPDNIEEDPFIFDQKSPEVVNELLLPEAETETISAVNPAISIEIYDNYNFEHEYPDSLPITEKREQVVQIIEANRATVIQGATGSGKTTQVPQYILDDHQQRRKYCNIIVTQPRRIAAISVSKRVSEERNWPLGTLVGYQIGRDRKVSEDTRITFVTTGVLLQKLIKNRNLGDYTHIILDEVHERDQDIDFSMLVLRKMLRTVSRHVKIILMSATVDSTLFCNYFSIMINGVQEGAPVLSVDGKMFDVDEYFFEDVAGLSEPPQQSIYEPEISEKCYRLCREIICALDKDELGKNYNEREFAENRGTVLCFLPGLPEIKEMHKFLADLETTKRLKIMPLHSEISSRDQVQVFIPSQQYQRKIILSTNIAESSITVPDIKYVIDFCLTKQNETDLETNYQRLTLTWSSKASLTQRKGRAGRVTEGHCFRLISKSFVNQLHDYCVPEMLRAPLEKVVLKVKLLELGPPAMILQLAIQPPGVADIKRTILLLKEVGALTVCQYDKINPLDGDLTFVGRVLGSLPLDVRIGKLLLVGYAFGIFEECLVIGACLSLKSVFMKSFRDGLVSYANKMHWARNSASDCLASFYAFLSWKFRKLHIGFGMPEKKWASENNVEYRRLYEIDELRKELEERLKSFNMIGYRDIFKSDSLNREEQFLIKLAIAAAFYPNYFQTQDIDEAEATKTMSGHNPCTTVVVHGAPPTLCYYRTNVANLFRQCGNGKRMYFENSRAFIEFETDVQNSETKVVPAVFKAVKMRHLRMPLNIHVSKKKDDQFRSTLNTYPLESLNPETGLRSNRVKTSLGGKGKLSVTLQEMATQIKMKEIKYISLIVQEIINPGFFWATYGDDETQRTMLQMHEKINAFDGRNLKPLKNLRVGAYCLAPFENEFFRAEIIDCSPGLIKVFFLDYGNSAVVNDSKWIRVCPDSLLEIPFQAFQCQLSEIRPVRGEWSEAAFSKLESIVRPGTQKLTAKVYSLVHDVYRVELFLNETSINKVLIEDGFAIACEEALISKTRHEALMRNESNESSANAMEMLVADASKIDEGEEVLKIVLRGPSSPYEQSFFGMTALGRMKSMRVSPDSVNSVVICGEPQDKHPRMLIAASINVNSAGNMIARETTYLPNIHGLTSLVPLLFAPVTEFRLNDDGTAITGFIAGLGCDNTGAPILPDHDLEVAIDIEFTEQDCGLINAIRYAINAVIGIDGDQIKLQQHNIDRVQKHVKEKLLGLINKEWKDIKAKHYRYEYHWQKLDSEVIMDCGYEDQPTHLYAYHKGIFLVPKSVPVIDERIVQQREHLRDLHQMAGKSLKPFKNAVECQICHVSCRHPHGLYLHCETPQHKNWVTQLFKPL